MQNSILVKNISTGKMVSTFLFIFVIISILINGKPFGLAQLKEMTGGVGIIDMEFNYNTEKVYDLIEKMGENGRHFYLKFIFFLDLIFPISYCLFLSSALLFFLRKNNINFGLVIFIPILAFLSDYTENFLMLPVYLNYPDKISAIISIANIFTIAKFVCILLSYLILLILIFLFVIKLIIKKNSR